MKFKVKKHAMKRIRQRGLLRSHIVLTVKKPHALFRNLIKRTYIAAREVFPGKHLVVVYARSGTTVVIVTAYLTSSFDRISARKERRGVWRRIK